MRTRKSTIRLRSDAFRAIALRRNQTLDDLARTLGIGERHFYRLLSGNVAPSPQTRANICRALELPFDELFEVREPLESVPPEASVAALRERAVRR